MNLGTATATITLNNSGFLSGVAQSEQAMQRLGSAGSKGLDGFSNKVKGLSGELTTVGAGLAGLGALIAVPFVTGVSAAASFEQGMANVRSVSGATATEFEALSDTALRIGKDTSFSANEATLAIEELSKAGVSVENILIGAADGATALAAATGTSLPQAATAIATSLNVFSLGGEEATRVANVFAAGANKAATDVGQLQLGLAQGGAVFAMYGMTVEESVGALSLFSDYGIQGSDAATSMKAALTTMNSGVGQSKKAMNALGISLYDANGEFVGMDGLASELQRTLGGLTEKERNLALTRLGGTDGMRALNILYNEGAAGVNEYTAAVTGTDAATAAAAIRMDTVSGAMEELRGSIETVQIVFMTRLLPAIRFGVDGLTMLTNVLITLPGPVQTAIVAVAGITGVLALLGGGFLLLLPQIVQFRTALTALGGMSGVLRTIGMGLRYLTIGAGLGALAPILLGVAAAAGIAYVAYRTNFLGIRDLVQGVVSGVTGFFGDLKDTWDDVWSDLDGPTDFMKRLNKLNGVADEAAAYSNRFARTLATIGRVMQRLSGMRFLGWLSPLGDAFENAGQFVEGFLDAWTALGTDGDSVMGRVSRWGGITEDLGNGFDVAARFLRAFSSGLNTINGGDLPAWIDRLMVGLDRLAGKVEGAGTVFRALREQGLNPLQAGFYTLMVTVPRFRTLIDSLEPAWRPAIDAFNAFRDGNYAEGFRQVGQSIQGMGEVLRTTAVNLGSIAVRIGGWAIEQAVDLGTAVYDWITGTAIPAISRTARTIGTFAVQIADWTVTALIGLGARVLTWIRDEAIPGIARGVQSIGNMAVRIADWLVSAGIDIGLRVLAFVQTAKGGITRVATDIGHFAVKIADWTVTAAIDIGQRVFSWIQGTALPTVSRVAFDIGTFAVKIADWTVTAAIDIGQRVLSWIQGTAIPTITRVATDIGNFAVKIADWTVSSAVKIGERVWSWITAAASTITRVAFDIGSFAIKISEWVKSEWADLTTWVNEEVVLSYNGSPESAADPGTVYVKVATFEIEVDAAALNTKINGAFKEETLFTAADEATAQQKGENIGRKVWDKIQEGISGAFTLGGGGGGGENSRSGIVGMSAEVRSIIGGFFDGIFEGIGDDIPAIPPYDFSQKFDNMFDTLPDDISGAWDTALASLTFNVPDITWPSFDFTLDDIPFYTEAKALVDEIKAWFKDPWGGTISVGAPQIDWPSMPGMPGGVSDADIIAAGAAKLGGGGNGERMPFASGGLSLSEEAGKYGRPGGGSADFAKLTASMNAAQIAANTLNTAMNTVKATISSIGSAMGSAGIGAAGAAIGAVGGGGGPFASLVTGANQLKTTITSLGTTLSAFNSGPLTTLNAGFPILAATILAFNSGPLTTLNAAFPILTASMTAFNAGPLTLLNAGFPILAATILAFNAGPLTTLNAAFPVLTASVLAFNTLGLTVLNAGFPILAATVLAFNAGPLTTLNAAFPILTASIVAFNTMGLTVLNAGFPILGATIMAFNAGALTTLNAAFPILTASMVAFNAGGLTLLNAGFPILGATILAFNAGPLTTLNSAFPIVGASATALGATLDSVGGNVTAFGATVSTMAANVSSGFAEMSGAATSNMAALEGAVRGGMANASSAVRGEAAQWPGIISGLQGAMSGAGRAVGAAAGQGVAQGMRGQIGSIRSAANEIVSEVDRALRAAARIASPSKLTAEVGQMLTQGVAAGMISLLGTVTGAAQSVVSAATPNAALPVIQATGVGSGMALGLAGGMVSQSAIVFAAGNAVAQAGVPGAALPVAQTTGVGDQMGAGLSNGILGSSGVVTGSAISVVTAALNAAKQAAGISSPASEWVPPGGYMDDGIAKGITDGAWKVTAAAVNVVRQAQAAAAAQARQQAATSGGGAGGNGGGLSGVYDWYSKKLGRAQGSMGGAVLNGWERLTDGFWKSVSNGVVKKGILAEDGGYVNPGFYAAGNGAGNAFGNGVTDGVRDSLQMHSPSRVLIKLGKTATASFAQGMIGPRSDVVRAADAIAAAITTPLEDATQSLAKTYRRSGNGRFLEEWLNVGAVQQDALDRALGTRTLAINPRRGQQVSAATRAGSRPNTAGGATHVTYVTQTETTHAPNVYQVVPEELHRIMIDSRDGGSAAASLRGARPSAQSRSGRRAPLRGV